MIKIESVNFSYSKKKNGFSLRNINLLIRRDEFTVILGPNGSGKTTLIKLIARLLKPHSGNFYLNDKEYEKIPLRNFYKKVAYVPQKFDSIFPYTVFEILLMGRSPYFNFLGFESPQDLEKVENILDLLGLKKYKNKKVNELSGGELQKVTIGRALVQDTDIILLDEPNTHLDLKHQIKIFNILKEVIKQGKTIVAVTHDLNLSLFYADRVVFIKNGEIYSEGAPFEVMNEENINNVFEVQSKIFHINSNSIPQIIINPKGE